MGVLFWGDRKLFTKSEKGARQALDHPRLRGLPIIGRGAYSIVLGAGASVFKLTIDQAAYRLAERQLQWKCPSLPEIHCLHGEIGRSDFDMPIFLIELERLEKLQVGSAVRKQCFSVAKHLRVAMNDSRSSIERLRSAEDTQTDLDLRQAIGCLAEFYEENFKSIHLDLHGANFMMRPGTGRPVISDPFMDMETRSHVFEKYRQKLSPDCFIV